MSPDTLESRPPTFTVIIAVWNGASTLQQALDSVFAQDGAAVQLVVMDGNSSDGTQAILARNGDRIAYWRSEPDRGVFDAWNKALDHATGDWICFLGADDVLHDPNVLNAVAAALADVGPSCRIAYGQVVKTAADGTSRFVPEQPWTPRKRARFRRGVMIPHPATFHHRSVFDERGRFDASFAIAGDYEFLLRDVLDRPPVYIPVYVADFRAGGLSTRPANRSRVAREVYRARHMHGIARLPAWCSPRLIRQLTGIWLDVHVRPRIAAVRGTSSRGRDAEGS